MARQKTQDINGFSLVEFSIVLVLFAIFMTGAIYAYDQYRQKRLLEHNAYIVSALKSSIDSYYLYHRHYPCPAPLSASRGDAAYGRGMDCRDTASGDYRMTTRSVDRGGGVTETVRIREGTFPFMDVKDFITEHNQSGRIAKVGGAGVLDAYGHQFTYVVVERQATTAYRDNGGGILIKDEFGRAVSGNADFLLISHGRNAKGARSIYGVPVLPCDGPGLDVENCNGDAEFVHGLQNHGEAQYYDDQIAFLRWVPYFLWKQTEGNPNNIYNVNRGFVGIGLKDPADQLHVKGGNVLVYRFWDDEGQMKSADLCSESGGVCFPPSLIGGEVFPQCPAGELMKGIAHSAPVCVKAFDGNVSNQCPEGSFISGMSYNVDTRAFNVTCKNPLAGRG